MAPRPYIPPQPPTTEEQLENSSYICLGCYDIFQGAVRGLDCIADLRPSICVGCECRSDEGYMISGDIRYEIEIHREHVKKQLLIKFSRETAERRRAINRIPQEVKELWERQLRELRRAQRRHRGED